MVDTLNIASFSGLSIGNLTFFAVFSLIPQLSPFFGLFSPRLLVCCADRIGVFRLVWIAAANRACYHTISGGRSMIAKISFLLRYLSGRNVRYLSIFAAGRSDRRNRHKTIFPAFAVGRIGSGFPHSQTDAIGGGMNRRIGSAGQVGSRRLVSTLFRHKPRYFDFSE